MSGRYYKIADDGAAWKCTECKEQKPAKDVILWVNTATLKTSVLCIECADPDWIASAICLGTK